MLIIFAFLSAGGVRAQLPQPLVFSSGGAVAVRNDQTGAMTAVSGSPFARTNQNLTLDVQGRYLFGIGVNSIHMYLITDASTGAYQEVANSPFASANTNAPLFIAVEATGNYIAVVDGAGLNAGEAGAETFQISANAPGGPALVPVAGSFTELDSTVVGVSQPVSGAQNFYLYLGPDFPSDAGLPSGEEFDVVSINASSGQLSGISAQNADSELAVSYAADPQGRFVVTGSTDSQNSHVRVRGIHGTFPGGGVDLPAAYSPTALWVDSTGTFVYVTVDYVPGNAPNYPQVDIYALNLTTGTLMMTTSSPLPGMTAGPGLTFQADPTGPFSYSFDGQTNSVTAYSVDPVSGYFVATANSPFSVAQIAGNLTFAIATGGQGVSGPSLQVAPGALTLASTQVGSTSAAQMIMVTSNGAEAVNINSIAVMGADASEFLESDTCQAPAVLAPAKFCSISIRFMPTASGAQSATLVLTDNAPGSPQMISLAGTGVTPPAAVSIAPNPLTFATITQGTSSGAMTITVTNTGGATLHISSAATGGNNPGDFVTAASACASAALTANASCAISVTFAPLAAGERSETITLTDDAGNSPQVINVSGNANAAIAVMPTGTSSTTASVVAGATAQYQLQIMPGANYSGTIAMTCAGAPAFATCQVPGSVQVSGGTAAMFTVMVTTTGAQSMVAPDWRRWRFTPWHGPMILMVGAWILVCAMWRKFGDLAVARGVVVTALVSVAIIFVCGCGGAPSAQQQQNFTPTGTSTIIVTPSAKNAAGQALQLRAIQLTLNVN